MPSQDVLRYSNRPGESPVIRKMRENPKICLIVENTDLDLLCSHRFTGSMPRSLSGQSSEDLGQEQPHEWSTRCKRCNVVFHFKCLMRVSHRIGQPTNGRTSLERRWLSIANLQKLTVAELLQSSSSVRGPMEALKSGSNTYSTGRCECRAWKRTSASEKSSRNPTISR